MLNCRETQLSMTLPVKQEHTIRTKACRTASRADSVLTMNEVK